MKRSLLFVSAAMFSCALAVPAMAQTMPGAGGPSTGMSSTGMSSTYDAQHPYADRFGDFLGQHPDLSQQLSQNPSLIDNQQYLASHPDLQQYLQHHPNVASAYRANPSAFMHRTDLTNGYHPGGVNPGGPNVGANQGWARQHPDAANFDQFLSQHPDMSQQLRQNPNLVDNPQYLASHPDLQQYLQHHPNVAKLYRQHPDQFMHRADTGEHWNNPAWRGNPDNTAYGAQHQDAARFDDYLDHNPQVGQELRKNPNLVDNPQYLASHPGLESYVKEHPNVAQAYKEHPNQFMRRADVYQRSVQRRQNWQRQH